MINFLEEQYKLNREEIARLKSKNEKLHEALDRALHSLEFYSTMSIYWSPDGITESISDVDRGERARKTKRDIKELLKERLSNESK